MINVLLVEDNLTAINVIKAFYNKIEGFSVIGECGNGAEALHFLETASVDLILVDIIMPVMDGLTFVETLRNRQNYTDIIFVTALNETDAVRNALKYGAVDYIVKPFSYERFFCTMQNYKMRYNFLSKKRSVNQYEIDKIINSSNDSSFNNMLPKGINQLTLNSILEVLEKMEDDFTVDQLLENIDMSKVALRNYMRFLSQEGIVESRIIRGHVGRPQYIYKLVR